MAQQQTSSTTWALIAIACLVLGLAVGYVIFSAPRGASVGVPIAQGQGGTGGQGAAIADEQQLQALRNILARDPGNLQANTQLGNMLFDAGRYTEAVAPYQRAFDADPKNVSISTDLGTALWYTGKPDEAVAQFRKSLAIEPNHPQTLFNLGVVLRDGKKDPAGAAKVWEQLLATNPSYPDRAKVQQSLDEVKAQIKVAPIAPVR